jgi:putative membrane-bound dehydrogenase-like protein
MSLVLALLGIGVAGGEIKPAADAPQPVPPHESLKRFKLAPGFRIELVASEPMLADPVGMVFDERGRLFVCELYGYNLDGHYDVAELNKAGELDMQVRRILAPKEILERAERESHGRVKLLEDTDRDGRMDRMTPWATNLPPCYGLVASRQGVIVVCAPDIVHLADRDGDDQPEVRETLFTGFGVGEMWTRISNPQWGLDNWIYVANGVQSGGTIRGPHLAQPVQLGNTCFRLKADGTALEPVSGSTGGFGLAMTDEDDRFLVSNQQHALHVAPLPHRYLARNPYYAAPAVVHNICTYGHPAQVFPNAPPDPWRLKRSQQPEWVKFYGAAETTMGLVTAACAPHVYRGDQFPPAYRGAHFSCECAYNLIHLCHLEPDGARYRAVRAIENGEFLTSNEQWFRPVNLAGGPDGALYIVDMYREIIEDYSAIPRYLQQQYGLVAGWDRGRVWRVRYDPSGNAAGPIPPAPPWDFSRLNTTAALVGELSSRNAWRRQTAQRLLVERGERSAVPELARLLEQGATPLGRLHALRTLEGLNALQPGTLLAALADASPGVRRHALEVSEPWLGREPALLARVLAMTDDPDPKVRIRLAFTLGETRDVRRLAALTALANRFGGDPWMQAAIVSSVPDTAATLFEAVVKAADLSDDARSLAPALVGAIGARQQPPEIAGTLLLVANYAGRGAESFQVQCLAVLGEALKRSQLPKLTDPAALAALGSLLASPSPAVRRSSLQLAGTLKLAESPELLARFEQAAQRASNETLPVAERRSAIALLAGAPFAVLQAAATNWLTPSQPLDIQLAAVSTLAASDDLGVVPLLLSGWQAYSPRMQTAVLDALFKRQERIKALLRAIQQNRIPRFGFDPLRLDLLRANPDAEIRRLAEPILARQATGADRRALLARYQAALASPRNAAQGKEVFRANCSTCHLLEGVGKPTGPELVAATKSRADETILLDILQPSDQITVGFRTYNVVTTRGHNLSGILAAETATSVTLPDEDGIPQTVLRKDIASFQASDVSLMPANFDELLAPQDVADLLGYLRQLAGPPPGPVMTLFDDDPAFVKQLNEGDGTACLVTNQVHHGAAALRITPPQRYATFIPGWQYRITERPGPGEYRYLRFAWKSPAGSGVMLEFADTGQWPPPDRSLRRYFAGQNTTGWQARRLSAEAPREWTEIVVDLWQDCGAFTLTGIAPTAMGGPAYFDRIELLRDLRPVD